jgi:hypothetical protein
VPNEEYYSIISFKGGTNNGCVTKETSHLYPIANFEFVNKSKEKPCTKYVLLFDKLCFKNYYVFRWTKFNDI